MADVKVVKKFDRVKKYVNDSLLATFGDAARLTRAIARSSIKRRVGGSPSIPGQPPTTRRGQIRNSILYDVDNKRQEAIIGPVFSRMGMAANIHEHGGIFHDQFYPPRPFMRPAFQKIVSRLPKLWKYSIK